MRPFSALLLLVACGSPTAPARPAAPASSLPVQASARSATADVCPEIDLPPPDVELLDPGAAPRRALRYTTAPEAARRFRADIDGGTVEAEVDPIGGGCFRFRVVTINASAADDVPFPAGVLRVHPRGAFWLDEDDDSGVRGVAAVREYSYSVFSIDRLTRSWLPLPEDPVGVGARWTATRSHGRRHLDFVEEHRFTLVRRDGDALEISVEIDAEAHPQIEVGANRISRELVTQTEHYSGRWTLQPGAPWPVGSLTGTFERRRSPPLPDGVITRWFHPDASESDSMRTFREQVARHGVGPIDLAGRTRAEFSFEPGKTHDRAR